MENKEFLPNLKMQISTPDEIRRAQIAFFALGAIWPLGKNKILPLDDMWFMFCEKNILSATASRSLYSQREYTEITLQKLEELAVKTIETEQLIKDLKDIHAVINIVKSVNGCICPKCGGNLYDSEPGVELETFPPQTAVACLKCDYKGCRTIQ